MSSLSDDDIALTIEKFALPSTKHAFQGVFPLDQLPKSIRHHPCFIVINTQSHNLPGEHWLAVYISIEKRGEIFDSLALPVSNYLRRWMNSHALKGWISSQKVLQDWKSNSCGAFVIYYVLHRLNRKEMPFTYCKTMNDVLVKSFYHTLHEK